MKKVLLAVCLSTSLVGCATTQNPYTGESQNSKTSTTAAKGAIAGAVVGSVAAGSDDRGKGAAIGALLGALGGGAYGSHLDKQEAELRQQLQGSGVSVQRNGDSIRLIMPGNITFGSNNSAITHDFYGVLNSVAMILKKYDKQRVMVTGHTDSTGSASYNLELSKKRAASVANYLIGQGVPSYRVNPIGEGFSQPIATNSTASGRAQNRRVEVNIIPN